MHVIPFTARISPRLPSVVAATLLLSTLTACSDPECEGECGPMPTARADMGNGFMRPDISIIGNPRDMADRDEGMIEPGDSSADLPDLPSGTLIEQSIITSEFGSDHNLSQLHIRDSQVAQVTLVRDFFQPAQSVQLIRANAGQWASEESFLDTLMNQATTLIGHDQLEPPSALYQSAANEEIYLASLDTDGRWEAMPLDNARGDASQISLQALARRGALHAAALIRSAGDTNELAIFIQTGPSSWAEPVIITPQSDAWTIEAADVALDAAGTAHVIYSESRPDEDFTGGKDSRVAYRSSTQTQSTDLFKGGAYEHRPTILVTTAGRLHAFYRKSDDLRSLPLNSTSYSVEVRTLEPNGSQWSDARSLQNDMFYYTSIEGPENSSALVGTDRSGDLFLRIYRNRTWGNVQAIKADHIAIPTSDTNRHIDAVFDSAGSLHIIYRTRDTELAYAVYRP